MNPTSAKVLIVEDEAANRRLFTHAVSRMGLEACEAADGQGGWDQIRAEKPDLVLLDLDLPVLSGLEVLRRIKQNPGLRHIPIIMLSAQDGMEIVEKCLEMGAEDYLVKPHDIHKLKARITGILRKREIQQESAARLMEEHDQKIFATYLESLDRLVLAAEFRDDQTARHLERISVYSAFLGRLAGLDGRTVEHIRLASPLHDVGKIAVPDNILLKNGKLTEEEFTVMKTHTTAGGKILSDSPAPVVQMAQRIAMTHHERWDGLGYPNGLQGEQIPIEGRVVGLVDFFDALTSRRPYKNPYPVDVALAMLERERGKQFDPVLVDLFLEQRAVFTELQQQLGDSLGEGASVFQLSERDQLASA